MSEELVTLEYDGPVAFVTLNSPGNRNSMSRKMMHELIDAFRTVGKDTDVRAVVLASTGKVFSAGHDLREVQGSDHATQQNLSLIHISEPTRLHKVSRMPSSA